MKTASVKKFVALRAALLNEKAQLEARLKEICAGLQTVAPSFPGGAAPDSLKSVTRKKRPARIPNKQSLQEAVTQVLASKPLTKPEILKAVDSLGYKFAAAKPMMSLNTLVYAPGKFKKHPGGKWGLLKK